VRVLEVGITGSRLDHCVAEKATDHRETLPAHDSMTGIDVPQILQSHVPQADLITKLRPRGMDAFRSEAWRRSSRGLHRQAKRCGGRSCYPTGGDEGWTRIPKPASSVSQMTYSLGSGVHFPASQIAVKECPVPGQKPLGDHMAIRTTGTAWQSLGIITNSGEQTAISSR
jgi:hypothetical protein